MLRLLGNILCDPDPKVKVKDQIMYFLVNVSPPKCSDRERHALCAIVPLKTEMSHRFLQWMHPGLFPIFTIIFGTK